MSGRLTLPGYVLHATASEMTAGRRWAAIASRAPLVPLDDPHPASAAALVDGLCVCASVLPWRGCGSAWPWTGERHGQKMQAAVFELDRNLPDATLVWGGDWNNALVGPEYAGSLVGRGAIAAVLARRNLQVPTSKLSSRFPGHATIDHVAVPTARGVVGVEHVDATGLSDHDAYVVTLASSELMSHDQPR